MDFNRELIETSSSISLAARVGDVETIKEHLRKGFSPVLPDNRGWTSIHFAAFYGHVEALRILLIHDVAKTNYLSNVQNWAGETPLMVACQKDNINIEVIRVLIENGAKTEMGNRERCTALHFACCYKDNFRIVRYMVSHGADVNHIEVMNGYTPLLNAIENHSDEILVKYLISLSDLSLETYSGLNPLFFACSRKYKFAVKEILKRSTDHINKLCSNFTPLTFSLYLNEYSIAKVLLNYGADVNRVDGNGLLPLHYSIQNATVFGHLLPLTTEQRIICCTSSEFCCSNIAAAVVLNTDHIESLQVLDNHCFKDNSLKELSFSDIVEYLTDIDGEISEVIIKRFFDLFKYYFNLTPEEALIKLMLYLTFAQIEKAIKIIYILFTFGINSMYLRSEMNKILFSYQNIPRLTVRTSENTEFNKTLLEIIQGSENILPLSLKQLTRLQIRQYISTIITRNLQACEIVESLNLPENLKSYLYFRID